MFYSTEIDVQATDVEFLLCLVLIICNGTDVVCVCQFFPFWPISLADNKTAHRSIRDTSDLSISMATPDKTAASVNNVVGDVVTNKQLSSDNATDDISNGKSTTGRGVEAFEINCTKVVTPPARRLLLETELALLGPDACKLFLSQGITTVQALLVESTTKNLATELTKQSHYMYSTARLQPKSRN